MEDIKVPERELILDIRQIAGTPNGLYVLCEDGSLWHQCRGEWEEIDRPCRTVPESSIHFVPFGTK